jgi:Holliday junction resolvasome RuvABC endonuclease subunit
VYYIKLRRIFLESNSQSSLELAKANETTKVIGFRVKAPSIYWAVVEGTKNNPVLVEHDIITPPEIYANYEAKQLSWCRVRILQILIENQPTIAAIRYPEPQSFRSPGPSLLQRARIEGVIIEAISSHKIEVVPQVLKTTSSLLESKSAKAYLSQHALRGLDWSNIKPAERKEAILVAAAALEVTNAG